MIAIAPASFDIHSPREGEMLYPIGVGCYCFIHSKGNARACYKDKAIGSHTFFVLKIFPEGTGRRNIHIMETRLLEGMPRIAALVLITILSSIGTKAFAEDFSAENEDGVTFYYNYINGGGEVEVTSGEGKYSGDIVIPETVTYEGETMKVTGIGEKAFNGCVELTSVTIPNGVTYIGEWAFYYCKKLSTVTIPNSVTSIGKIAFADCKSLSSVTIPSSVTEIGGQAFSGCTSLTSVAIPNGVTSIEYMTFMDCTSLTSVEIPESVQKIDNEAFSCTNLASITIPGNVQEIGNEAFKGCHNLTTVTSLMKEPCKLGSSVFSGNTLYKGTLYVPNGTVNKYKVTDGWKEFSHIEASDGSGDEPEAPICETPTIDYNNGKLTFSCATEDVEYISEVTSEDIRKYYTDKVNLAVTYRVSVYAVKAGYTNSDIATATLCWLDAEPKTEGTTTDIATAKGCAVMMQAYGGALHIDGVKDGTRIVVYSMTGAKVGETRVAGGTATIPTGLRRGDIAIVRIGSTSVKVMMR